MRILSFDPGGTTGCALFDSDGVEGHSGDFHSWQEDSFESCVREADTRIRFKAPDVLLAERFTIRANSHKLSATAFEETTDTIGAVRLLALRYDIPFVRQSPAQAKSFGTDEKLRKIGWYRPALGHGNDASRHVLVYLAGIGYAPVLQRLVSEEAP